LTPSRSARCASFLIWALILVAALAGSPTDAQAQDRIRVPVPGGWTAAAPQRAGPAEVHALYPPGQSAAAWTDQLIIQKYPGGDPIQYLQKQEAVFREHCREVRATEIVPMLEDGHPTAIRTIACSQIEGQAHGEEVLFKATRAGGTLFVLSRSWRLTGGRTTRPGAIAEWSKIFHDARPCGGTAGACPSGGIIR